MKIINPAKSKQHALKILKTPPVNQFENFIFTAVRAGPDDVSSSCIVGLFKMLSALVQILASQTLALL